MTQTHAQDGYLPAESLEGLPRTPVGGGPARSRGQDEGLYITTGRHPVRLLHDGDVRPCRLEACDKIVDERIPAIYD